MGIDCSTKSLAYGIFEGDEPVTCGEVQFQGASLYERLNDAHRKVPPLVKAGVLQADYIAFESAWTGPNPQVGINLAMVYGAVIGALMQAGMEVVTVPPLTWQAFIGNPNLKKAEKEQIKADHPGKSASWYSNAGRQMRKQRTLRFSQQFFKIDNGSDNVGDAVAIAYYANTQLTKR